MIARVETAKVESATAKKPIDSENISREAPMIAEHCPAHEHCEPLDRKLRNRILLANAIAWIVIIVLINMAFF